MPPQKEHEHCSDHSGVEQCQKGFKQKLADYETEIKRVWDIVGNKLEKRMFYITISILASVLTIFAGTQWALLSKMGDVQKDIAIVANDMGYMKEDVRLLKRQRLNITTMEVKEQ